MKRYITPLLVFILTIAFVGAGCNTTQTDEILKETAELFPVENYTGSGTATRTFIGDEFAHIVTAQLDDPADDMFYEGWLVREPIAEGQFSTGKMEKIGNDYFLEYTSDQNYPEHNTVVITLEKVLDDISETHVLEGSF